MAQISTTYILNQLLAIVGRSFPQYLQYSRPYIPPGREDVLETLNGIVTDQNRLADRISQMIIDADDVPRPGGFPMEYTDKHDLGIDYLIRVAIEYQKQDIELIQSLIEALQLHPAAKSLAEEALGMAKGHLDSLEELNQQEAVSS